MTLKALSTELDSYGIVIEFSIAVIAAAVLLEVLPVLPVQLQFSSFSGCRQMPLPQLVPFFDELVELLLQFLDCLLRFVFFLRLCIRIFSRVFTEEKEVFLDLALRNSLMLLVPVYLIIQFFYLNLVLRVEILIILEILLLDSDGILVFKKQLSDFFLSL